MGTGNGSRSIVELGMGTYGVEVVPVGVEEIGGLERRRLGRK